LGRVLTSVVIGTLWAVPAGLTIGLSPRLSRVFQPVVQVLASFPAPLLFPVVVYGLHIAGVHLNWGSILLMLLGTQWYILFNVIAGAMAVPADLKEAARSYRITGVQRFRVLYFPALFPFLVTGWVTAAGGAWNASIVAEQVEFERTTLNARGLGDDIMRAAAGDAGWSPESVARAAAVGADPLGVGPFEAATSMQADMQQDPNYPLLAAAVLVMSSVVVLFNRTVWHWCYRTAEEKFSVTR
jgi:NitT/TauT family transport system permease protein